MKFKDLNIADHEDFSAVMEIYAASFPANERHPEHVIKSRLKIGLIKIQTASINGKIAFMALLWPLKNTEFILLDYMATSAEYRSKHIGSEFLETMTKTLRTEKKYFILEVENPLFGDNREERLRRVNFYRKNGARELKGLRYILPPLQGDQPTEMILMIFPEYPNARIEGSTVNKLIVQLYKELYNRDESDELLRKLIINSDIPVELV